MPVNTIYCVRKVNKYYIQLLANIECEIIRVERSETTLTLIAHKADDGREQPLDKHLQNVSRLAAEYAEPIGGQVIARRAGLAHDIGKCTDGFQRYIRDPEHNIKCPHSIIGAVACAKAGDLVSALVAEGHHTGLHDMWDVKNNIDTALIKRTNDVTKAELLYPVRNCALNDVPLHARTLKNMGLYSFVRMEYSCLVDADYIDTETFMRGTEQRLYTYDTMQTIYDKLCHYVEPWITAANELSRKPFNSLSKEQQINLMRTEMLQQCFDAGAKSAKGDIRLLSIPTGGAKTISSFAYAAAAAKADTEISRIIVVTPYTSITSQTASVLRDIAGKGNVLEHHSGYDFDNSKGDNLLRLASENYDVPIVVTTDVQLFESFYANKPSKSRKLHNLVNSVIIFDEVQQLKPKYLKPCIKCIESLATNYGCRIVLCTATQPAIEQFFDTVKPKEIIDDPAKYIAPFQRCEIEDAGHISVKDLITMLLSHEQCLCVANEKEEAKYLYKELKSKAQSRLLYCLTTDLTPYDKARYIAEIKQHLANGDPCIVVSTSLIECGVDLDFPYGYRELAGLDSVLQTAGRINRNGKRDCNTCKLIVFEGPQDEVRALQGKGRPPEEYLHNEKNITKRLFATEDITLPETATKYFESLYKYYKGALDEKGILKMAMPDDGKIQFQKIAENFHLIEEDTVTVIIPQTPEAVQLIAKLRNQTATRRDIRKVGKYSVNVRRKRYNDRFADVTESLVMNAGKTVDICCLTNMHRYTEYGLEML